MCLRWKSDRPGRIVAEQIVARMWFADKPDQAARCQRSENPLGVRENGLKLLAHYRISEGLDICVDPNSTQYWGMDAASGLLPVT